MPTVVLDPTLNFETHTLQHCGWLQTQHLQDAGMQHSASSFFQPTLANAVWREFCFAASALDRSSVQPKPETLNPKPLPWGGLND